VTRRPHWKVALGTGGTLLACTLHPGVAFPTDGGCAGCWRAAIVRAGFLEGPLWSYVPAPRERRPER
jgi:hypothetical protein